MNVKWHHTQWRNVPVCRHPARQNAANPDFFRNSGKVGKLPPSLWCRPCIAGPGITPLLLLPYRTYISADIKFSGYYFRYHFCKIPGLTSPNNVFNFHALKFHFICILLYIMEQDIYVYIYIYYIY